MSVRVNRVKIRRSWNINPRERIVESKKVYNRADNKGTVRKEMDDVLYSKHRGNLRQQGDFL